MEADSERHISFSQLSTYQYCALAYKYKYLDGIDVEPDNSDPANPLFIGRAIHEGIAKGIDAAIELYDSFYPLEEDKHIEEKLKLEYLIPKVQALLPKGEKRYEFYFNVSNFVGYIDLLVKTAEGTYELYDFKYSSNPDKYKESPQVHMYRYALSLLYPNIKISRMGYIMIPKTAIRLKKAEEVSVFRSRLRGLLDEMQPYILDVSYNEELAKRSLQELQGLDNLPIYPPAEEKKCRWCEYALYCKTGDLNMIPVNQRRQVQNLWKNIKVYIYGAPYSGKTTAAESFPNPLFFNTDGNYNSFTAPYIAVKDTEENGFPVKGWEKFLKDVDELLATPNHGGYETVVIDQVDGLYELCRRYVCDKLHISHESEDSTKAWDITRTEFIVPIKMLASDPEINLVLISQEDSTRDLFSRSGNKVTSFKPNIQEKVAIRLSSFVDMTMRLVNDTKGHYFSFKSDSNQFGGCRIANPPETLPASYMALRQWIDSVHQRPANAPEQPIPNMQQPVQSAGVVQSLQPQPAPVQQMQPVPQQQFVPQQQYAPAAPAQAFTQPQQQQQQYAAAPVYQNFN